MTGAFSADIKWPCWIHQYFKVNWIQLNRLSPSKSRTFKAVKFLLMVKFDPFICICHHFGDIQCYWGLNMSIIDREDPSQDVRFTYIGRCPWMFFHTNGIISCVDWVDRSFKIDRYFNKKRPKRKCEKFKIR